MRADHALLAAGGQKLAEQRAGGAEGGVVLVRQVLQDPLDVRLADVRLWRGFGRLRLPGFGLLGRCRISKAGARGILGLTRSGGGEGRLARSRIACSTSVTELRFGAAVRGAIRCTSCASSTWSRASNSSPTVSGRGIRPAAAFLPPVRAAPTWTANGRRLIAGPRPRNWPRWRSRMRSACLRSIPRRSAARCMSISRKVRPIRKFDASAATFLANLASR